MIQLMKNRGSIKKTTKNIGEFTKNIGDSPWIDLFTSKTLARLLTFFLTRPDESFYQKELMDNTKASLYVVQRELKRLEKAELIKKEPRGNRVYYSANRKHPAFDDLKRVIIKTLWIGEFLRLVLSPLNNRVKFAFIYGSFARSEETLESDIDLLIVGDLKLKEASSVLGPVSRELGREFNPVIYTPDEFQERLKKRNHFITEVIKGKKIFLIGNENDIKEFVG